MKIIYCTDIHGGFVRVYNLLRETIADLYLISGDLIDLPFYSLEQSLEYLEMQNQLNAMRRESTDRHVPLEEYVDTRLKENAFSGEMEYKARYYLDASQRAREVMLKKYQILENIFAGKESALIAVIPGNYDMDLAGTALDGRNLHLKTMAAGGLTVAGYGGAAVRTPGFPETYQVRYRGKSASDTDNEMYRFLEGARPDIIAVHHPAYGVLDTISHLGSWGSTALRTYCDNNWVMACCSGHIHENWGVRYVENTLYLNPSNFGEVMTSRGDVSEGGFFFEITVDGARIPEVRLRKIVEYRVYDVADYRKEEDAYRETVVDSARMQALIDISVLDENIERYNQVPELKIFRDIRNFFRIHQTKQSEERVKNLERALGSLGPLAGHVALDLVGSVNMGMAQDSSDVDAVLYLRGQESCGGDFESCDFAKGVAARIKEILADRHGFQTIDFINLDIVEASIKAGNAECDQTQRFAVYRSFCRPVNYRLLAPVEDLLNRDVGFRRQVEENMRSYLRVLASSADTGRSFEKYLTRLKSAGVVIPGEMMHRIEVLLQKKR
ncbi:MAG: metallophosphoesterase [Spirochaetes bacterium]|nr:metallophosphoesterase [Spirochaetota bacterium]